MIFSKETGAKTYTDPRLALPFKRTPNGRPITRPKFDQFSTVTEVLDDCDVSGKHVVLLGGTGGVGWYLAKALTSRGAIVTCLSRNPPTTDWQPFPGPGCVPSSARSPFWASVDLTQLKSVVAFAKTYISSSWPLDSLVLLAATVPESGDAIECAGGFNSTLQVNFMAQVLLARLLHQRLCQAPQSTITFVSCEAYRASSIIEAEDFYEALESNGLASSTTLGRVQLYANTKHLQILFAKALRQYQLCRKRRAPHIYVCSPGNLIWNSRIISRASWTCWWWLKILQFLAYPISKNMECAAATIAYCSVHPGACGHRSVNDSASDNFYFSGCVSLPLAEVIFKPEVVRAVWVRANALLERHFPLPPWE
ncbi:unnamed protein product [Mesocestoides corti]|uniref:NAD-dependent epimerase/dehydratase domain-containing protein n=1 Tax=Mesocestoides corti TaxID=53468 RepID=A0A0R3UB80_MESCO|nr:unnamed protein product [Mesocestoides corti]